MTLKAPTPDRLTSEQASTLFTIDSKAVVLAREGRLWRAYPLWHVACGLRCRSKLPPLKGMRTKSAYIEHLRSFGQAIYEQTRGGDFVLLARPYDDVSSNVSAWE